MKKIILPQAQRRATTAGEHLELAVFSGSSFPNVLFFPWKQSAFGVIVIKLTSGGVGHIDLRRTSKQRADLL
jgi:hypothetical protein